MGLRVIEFWRQIGLTLRASPVMSPLIIPGDPPVDPEDPPVDPEEPPVDPGDPGDTPPSTPPQLAGPIRVRVQVHQIAVRVENWR